MGLPAVLRALSGACESLPRTFHTCVLARRLLGALTACVQIETEDCRALADAVSRKELVVETRRLMSGLSNELVRRLHAHCVPGMAFSSRAVREVLATSDLDLGQDAGDDEEGGGIHLDASSAALASSDSEGHRLLTLVGWRCLGDEWAARQVVASACVAFLGREDVEAMGCVGSVASWCCEARSPAVLSVLTSCLCDWAGGRSPGVRGWDEATSGSSWDALLMLWEGAPPGSELQQFCVAQLEIAFESEELPRAGRLRMAHSLLLEASLAGIAATLRDESLGGAGVQLLLGALGVIAPGDRTSACERVCRACWEELVSPGRAYAALSVAAKCLAATRCESDDWLRRRESVVEACRGRECGVGEMVLFGAVGGGPTLEDVARALVDSCDRLDLWLEGCRSLEAESSAVAARASAAASSVAEDDDASSKGRRSVVAPAPLREPPIQDLEAAADALQWVPELARLWPTERLTTSLRATLAMAMGGGGDERRQLLSSLSSRLTRVVRSVKTADSTAKRD
jgi:hypothetical protein